MNRRDFPTPSPIGWERGGVRAWFMGRGKACGLNAFPFWKGTLSGNRFLAFLILGLFMVLAGCAKPPTPLTLEEIPGKMNQVFATAKIHVKKTADAIVELVKGNQWPGAAMQLRALLSNTTLTKEQRDVATQALMAVNIVLKEQAETLSQAPAAPGDADQPASAKSQTPEPTPQEAATAAAVREHYLRTK